MSAKFKLEWTGLDSFRRNIQNFDKTFERELKRELMYIALKTEKYAKALTYYDHGELEDSIGSTSVTKVGKAYVVEVGTNNEYARRLHELHNPNGIGDKYERGVRYPNYYIGGRGKRTRDKPNLKGYMPGRKFLSNAVTLSEDEFETGMKNALRRALEVVAK